MKLTIENLGMNFEGIARSDGKVYFVPYALPKEEVEVEVKVEKPKFCEAKLIEVKTPSPLRVQPFCPYYEECGGCDLQHLLYEAGLKEKAKKVKETLFKVGGIDVQVFDTVSSDKTYFYRNKGAFPITNGTVGMFKKSSHDLMDINQCFLMKNEIQTAFKIVKKYVEENKFKGYDFKNFKGDLKYLVVRSINGQTLVCLVADKKIEGLNTLYEALEKELQNVGLYLNINSQKNSTILGREFIHIGGIKKIELNEFNIDYMIDLASFLQINEYIKTKIYEQILEEVKDDIVVDAYAGAGLLSAVASTNAKHVYSLEIVKEASASARELCKANGIKNMTVLNGDCASLMPKVTENLKSFSVILDPARVGCDEKVLKAISNANKIVYLSCNPISLAKDLKTLTLTHDILSVTPYDMFPETAHVETLVVLKKR